MELMSSLLLCALAALSPQALDAADIDDPIFRDEVKRSIDDKRKIHSKLLLNINGPPLITKANELHAVFNDQLCSKCTECMENAIKAHEIQSHLSLLRPSSEELNNDVLNSYNRGQRYKRDKSSILKIKKVRTKNNLQKSFVVTKYKTNGKINVLKINEIAFNPEKNTKESMCLMYRIKRSFSCNSSEADLLLKVRNNMRKYSKQGTGNITQEKTKLTTTMPKKREVDETHVQENYMPSIEEMDYV